MPSNCVQRERLLQLVWSLRLFIVQVDKQRTDDAHGSLIEWHIVGRLSSRAV